MSICTERGYQAYIDFVEIRHECNRQCSRDCIEKHVRVLYDVSTINDLTNRSIVIISPNFEIFQTISYEPALNIIEFAGYLGGHAHIWLGLSAIQFYNVMVRLLKKVIKHLKYKIKKFRKKF